MTDTLAAPPPCRPPPREELRRALLAIALDPDPRTLGHAIAELARFIEEQSVLMAAAVRAPDGLSAGDLLASALVRVTSAARAIGELATPLDAPG